MMEGLERCRELSREVLEGGGEAATKEFIDECLRALRETRHLDRLPTVLSMRLGGNRRLPHHYIAPFLGTSVIFDKLPDFRNNRDIKAHIIGFEHQVKIHEIMLKTLGKFDFSDPVGQEVAAYLDHLWGPQRDGLPHGLQQRPLPGREGCFGFSAGVAKASSLMTADLLMVELYEIADRFILDGEEFPTDKKLEPDEITRMCNYVCDELGMPRVRIDFDETMSLVGSMRHADGVLRVRIPLLTTVAHELAHHCYRICGETPGYYDTHNDNFTFHYVRVLLILEPGMAEGLGRLALRTDEYLPYNPRDGLNLSMAGRVVYI